MAGATEDGTVMDYLVMGPEGSGKRTLATHLEFARGYDFAALPPARQRHLRLGVQVAAAEALLLAARGRHRVPRAAADALADALAHSGGAAGLAADPARERAFLAAAAAFAADPAVQRAARRADSVAHLDAARAHLLDAPAAALFAPALAPTLRDAVCAHEPPAALREPRTVRAALDDGPGAESIAVTTLPAPWLAAAAQDPGSDAAARLDALCARRTGVATGDGGDDGDCGDGTQTRPFAAVFVVPLDEYCADDSGSGRGTSLEAAALREHREDDDDDDGRDEKKEKEKKEEEKRAVPAPVLAATAPARVGVPSLLARRQRAAAAAAAAAAEGTPELEAVPGKPSPAPGPAPAAALSARGRRRFALSVDTTPLAAGARAVRLDACCETPTTCTAPLAPALAPQPTAVDAVTSELRRVALAPQAQAPQQQQRPLQNKLTAALRAVRRLAARDVVRRAAAVFVLLTRADRFDAACPRVASIRCCLPDYADTGAETAAGSAAYVAALFDAALAAAVPPARRHVLRCTLVDAAHVRAVLVPALLAPARAAAAAAAHARAVRAAEAALRAAKRAAGCVAAPATGERARLRPVSGHATARGRRATNEDTCGAADAVCDAAAFAPGAALAHYAVYDGHNGTAVAARCARVVPPQLLYDPRFPHAPARAFRDAYARADRLVTAPGDRSGATAVTAVVFGTTLFVANIGDSECILVSRRSDGDGDSATEHTVLTAKHVLADAGERARVEALGGTVVGGRLAGALEVSRAFGDAEYKQPGAALVSVEPHVAVRALCRRDELLVLACDGLWDTVPHADAARHAAALRAAGASPAAAAHALVQLALDRGSTDNVTVVVVYFEWTP